MTTQISSNNIQPATLAVISQVTITSIVVTNSSWTPLDDSAVSTSGGFIVITGTNFATGCNVIIGSTNATSVSFVNSTTLRVQVPAMSAGTYVVYVTNTNGTTAIIVNGLTYSGTPTWVTASPLPQGITNTAISIQLSATGDTPLTYALQAGSSLPAGLTLSSSGLLSGTVSGLTSETTYNFTVEAIDPQLQESPKAFAITILAGDQLWDYVTLLLPGTTSTSIFNDDASTNNFNVTITGDTRPNNFNPYTPGYYSNFFDGTGDWLTFTGTTTGSGNFTTEAWVYLSSLKDYQVIFDNRATGATATGYAFGVDAAGKPYIFTSNAFQILSSIVITSNSWNHIALVRTGTTITLYVNGVSGGSYTSSANFSDTNCGIGIAPTFTPTSQFFGYISNLRVVNGTAVYTANFTPSTTPLTAISGTSLLTCQSNRFIDNSTNNFTITRNGDVTVNGFDPFVPSNSTATLGSTYFDGTGDYLSAAGNIAFAMSTGDFTYEAWINPISISSYYPIIGQFSTLTTGVGSFLIPINSSRQIELYYDGQTYATFSSATVTLNTWNHVAIVRSGSTITGYINGVVAGTVTYSGIFGNSSTNLEIGGTTRSGGNLWANGYISNVRVVKGTAVYTANFTPPTAPLTAIANTSLLTCQTNQPVENNDFLDSSTNNFLVTRNGNTTQGTFSPYAENWSNFFNGSTGYLAIPNNAAFAFGAGSLTVEAWIYTGVRTDFQSVIGTFDGGSNAWYIHTNASGTITYGLSPNAPYVASVQVCDNVWHHVAMVRNGSSDLRFYVDGVLADSRTDSSQPTPAAEIRIGSLSSGFTRYFNGYISNARVVKGTAVYTSNFTPSITPLQPILNTSLLTCRDSSFVDDSANRFTVTSNGNASVQKFGPFAGTTLPTPYYGAYFDGNGDYLTVASNAATTLSANFTIEFWIYRSVSGNNYFFCLGDVNTTSGIEVYIGSTGTALIVYSNGANRITSATLPAVGAWSHVAMVRSGTTVTLYLNGTSLGTWTSSATFSGTTYIGAEFFNGSVTGVCTGYISNARVVNGTAVYTANFTPPTQPLTAITNTSLLTCQSATFIDNSTNNFAITAFGNSQPTLFNPFTVTYSTLQSYSPSVFGGSMYFDGTGDFLTLASNAAFNVFGGNMTIECWFYANSFANSPHLFAFVQDATNRVSIYFASSALTFWSSNSSGNGPRIATSALTTNTWYHMALVKSGATFTLYLNGTAVGTSTTTQYSTSNQSLQLGTYNSGSFAGDNYNGYISDARIVRGTALYTSNFVPSNQPLTAVRNSVLLLNGTAGGIIDVSSGNNLETVADTKLSVVQSKWPSTSMFFDGTGDYMLATPSNNLEFGSGDFTIEFWLYRVGTGRMALYHGSFGTDWSIGIDISSVSPNTSNTIGIWASSNGTSWNLINADLGGNGIGTIPVAQNTWTHIAYVRSGTTWRSFVNGVVDRNLTGISGSIVNRATSPKAIGAWFSTGSLATLNGYLQDFRITKGVARYTTNFTPPTGPFITN